MRGWLRRGGQSKAAPLTGAPPAHRQKTHSADSGYVYQYDYQGYRVANTRGVTATEYVFEVSAGRSSLFPVSVYVPDDATGDWEQTHQRDLNSTERYAIAKIALFRAFDQRANPQRMRQDVWVNARIVAEALETLGID